LIFTELKFAKDSYNNRTAFLLPKVKLLKGWPIEVEPGVLYWLQADAKRGLVTNSGN
jgi:hypothetical protein